MVDKINEIQKLQFRLIEKAGRFNGKRVVKDLKKNKASWKGVILDKIAHEGNLEGINLIKLRDLEKNSWNCDTVFVLTNDSTCANKLKELNKYWKADEINIYPKPTTEKFLCSSIGDEVLIAFWWD